MFTRGLSALLGIALLATSAGCGRTRDDAEADDDLVRLPAVAGTLNLSEEAQTAIGLRTEEAVVESVRDALPATGWLEVMPGRESVIKAPATGFYLPGLLQSDIEVGATVEDGQALGSLRVFLSPQEAAQLVVTKEEADVLMGQALVSQRLAEEQLERLQAGAQTAVAGTRLLELEEIVERSKVAYREGKDRLPFLPPEPYKDHLDLNPVSVESPGAGRITAVHISPRQLVVQGDPLWTVADWSSLWLRVPVFQGDLPRVLDGEPAQVIVPESGSVLDATRVAAPQPTVPGRRTVDVLYRLDNAGGGLRPGQPVSVRLPLGDAVERVVISRSALLWDGLGNASVYVRTGPETFRRRRVELGHGDSEAVSVERGIEPGESVVTVGAASLYGEEFAGEIPAGDDD